MAKKDKIEASRFEKIMNNFEYAKKTIEYRKLPNSWNKMEKYYDNRYWEGSSRSSYLTRHTSNELFETVEVMLPIVTSRAPRPDVEVEPPPEVLQSLEEKGDEAFREYLNGLGEWSDKLQKQLIDVFIKSDMQTKAQEAYRDYGIRGNYCVKSYYDSKKGVIVNEVIDLACCLPDPMKGTIEDCYDSWFVYADYKDVEDIKKEYGIEVPPEGDFDFDGTFRYYNQKREATKQAMGSAERKGFALVIQMYSKSDEEEEYERDVYDDEGMVKKDDEGNVVKENAQRTKYKYGKIETIIRNHENKVVKTVPNAYPRLPFFMGANFKRRGDIWGISDGKNLETHIHVKNQIISNINDNVRATGNPQKLKHPSVTDVVNNDPNKVYTSEIPDAVKNIDPPSMPAYIQQFLQYNDQDRDRKSGINDALRGESVSGDSGVKTQALISQATGRIQPKVLEFHNLYRKLYEHWAFIIRNYYPEIVTQKKDDEEGNLNYTLFNTKLYPEVDIKVKISLLSMLPLDPQAEFEEMILVNRECNSVFGYPPIAVEQLIDAATAITDKQRAKDNAAKIQQQGQEQAQKEELLGQFEQIAGAFDNVQPGSQEEEQLFGQVVQIIFQIPEILTSPLYQALPDRLKKGIAMYIANGGAMMGNQQSAEAVNG